MPDNNQNQQFSDDDQELNMTHKESLQFLADKLNAAPRRRTSLFFLGTWFLGYKDVLAALLNAVFFGVPVFFFALGKILGYKPFEPSDLWWVFICLFFGVFGLALLTPYCKAVYLFKKGYFTLGYLTELGLVYKDSSGKQHCWTPTRFYKIGQPFMDYMGYLHRQDEPYLVVVGKNPYNLLIMDAVSNSEKDGLVGFNIFMGLYAIVVSYNLQSKTFISNPPGLWRWFIPVGIILWTLLWFFFVFAPVD